jgi:hypothetical protein
VGAFAGIAKPMTPLDPQPDAPKSERHWFQFSLAELLGLTTVVAVTLSLMKWSPWFGVLVVTLYVWIAAIHIERRSSSSFSWKTLVVIIVAWVLFGLLWAAM